MKKHRVQPGLWRYNSSCAAAYSDSCRWSAATSLPCCQWDKRPVLRMLVEPEGWLVQASGLGRRGIGGVSKQPSALRFYNDSKGKWAAGPLDPLPTPFLRSPRTAAAQ